MFRKDSERDYGDVRVVDYPDPNEDVRMDLVTVFHNERNYKEHLQLERDLLNQHPYRGFRFIAVDNRITNRGFAPACNLGATFGSAPIIGFINPDARVFGQFMLEVIGALAAQKVVITGPRYDKPQRELNLWGVRDWVCGAAFFVKRYFFQDVNGFDEHYLWSFEETDLIRTAESMGYKCKSRALPIDHSSPDIDLPEDEQFKRRQFALSQKYYYSKWSRGQSAV